jgi:hypothetical protein
MIAATRANSPRTGSPTIKPANDARMTTADAIVILMMFSNLMPFCVWYVYYDFGVMVYVVYPEVVMQLLFINSPGD